MATKYPSPISATSHVALAVRTPRHASTAPVDAFTDGNDEYVSPSDALALLMQYGHDAGRHAVIVEVAA